MITSRGANISSAGKGNKKDLRGDEKKEKFRWFAEPRHRAFPKANRCGSECLPQLDREIHVRPQFVRQIDLAST
jgi:hypothetical protein